MCSGMTSMVLLLLATDSRPQDQVALMWWPALNRISACIASALASALVISRWLLGNASQAQYL